MTIACIFAVAGLIAAILSAIPPSRVPLWVAVILLSIAEVCGCIPLR